MIILDEIGEVFDFIGEFASSIIEYFFGEKDKQDG